MKKEELPDIIYFDEKAGTNGIHCLDYQNESTISYIRSDLVKNNIAKSNVIESFFCGHTENCIHKNNDNTCKYEHIPCKHKITK